MIQAQHRPWENRKMRLKWPEETWYLDWKKSKQKQKSYNDWHMILRQWDCELLWFAKWKLEVSIYIILITPIAGKDLH